MDDAASSQARAADLLDSVDWSAHPLGPREGWARALQAAVRNLLASPESSYLIWGPERFFFFNDAYRPILGPRLDVAMGARFEELWADAYPSVKPAFDRAQTGEGVRIVDLFVPMARWGAPEDTWWTFSYAPLFDAAGNIVGVLCITNETTDHVRRSDVLSRTEENLARAQQAGQVGVFSIAIADRRIVGTPEFWRIFGLPPTDDATADIIEDLVVAEDAAMISNAASRAAETMALQTEYRIRRADTGEVRCIERRAEFEHDALGQPTFLLGVVQDVTERRNARDALAALNATLEQRVRDRTRERNLLATIIEETDDFVHVVDRDYRWLAVNTAGAVEFERVFGTLPRIGDRMLDLLADQPAERAAVEAVWSRALAGEEFTEISEFGDPAHVAERHTYEMKFKALRDEAGQLQGSFQMVRDITPRVRAAEQLALAQEALRQSQKMEAIGQLTGGVAHDFNNLLTVIRSSADLLRRRDLPDERRRRYVDAIADTADRAAKLTAQLLAFSRRQALQPEPFDVVGRIRSISDMLRTVLGARIVYEIHATAGVSVVHADPNQFDTALVNMAVNARDAMEGEGRLTLKIQTVDRLPAIRGHEAAVGAFVAVQIADTGSGIAPDDLARIFDPFFTTKDVGRGTGLGLSQVYGFAKQSGGEIDVASTDRGATFTLYLPRTDAQPRERQVRPHEPLAAKGRILVVEDNVRVGEFANDLLTDLGYETLLAGTAAQALSLLEDADPPVDLVFSDIVMPGMSGIELAQLLRQTRPGLPVVLTSGYSHALAEDGGHGFPILRKPYSVEDLSHVLANARRG